MKHIFKIILLAVFMSVFLMTGCIKYDPASDGYDGPKVIPEALTFMISSGTSSSFTPCGCHSGKWGGLPRRGTIFSGVENEVEWPVLFVDTGDVTQGSAGESYKKKDEYIFQAYAVIDYDFVNVGFNELRLGNEDLKRIGLEHSIPWSSANVYPPNVYPDLPEVVQETMPFNPEDVLDSTDGVINRINKPPSGDIESTENDVKKEESESPSEDGEESIEHPDAPTQFQPFVIVEPEDAPGFKIGFIGAMIQTANRLNPMRDDFSFEPYEDAIRRTVDILRIVEKVDLIILVSDADNYNIVGTETPFEGIDIVIGGNSSLQRSPNAFLNPLNPNYRPNYAEQQRPVNTFGENNQGGETEGEAGSEPAIVLDPLELPLFVPKSAGRAKLVKRFDITLNEDGLIVDYHSKDIRVSDDYADDPRMAEISRGFDSEILANELGDRIQRRYAGSDACEECHPGYLAAWSDHGHFHTYQTIEDESKLDDRECTRCHALGFMNEGRLLTYDLVPETVRNVGCEGCHSNGQNHIRFQKNLANLRPEDRERSSASDSMKIEILNSACNQCHTRERSGSFNFQVAIEAARAICRSVEPPVQVIQPVSEPEDESESQY